MAFKYVAGCPAPCATAGNVTAAALAAVVAAAKASEYTVVVLGHTTFFENESRDRGGHDRLLATLLAGLRCNAGGALGCS